MCCFSGPVQSVENTRIFARGSEKGRQFIVYSMKFSSSADVAMILPLPVPEEAGDDAVRFIDLKEYKQFFSDLHGGLYGPPPKAAEPYRGVMPAPAPLKVVDVGDFEASFVPTVKDFARLDARFRLPEGTWDALPGYRSFGFAVFKLKKETKAPHPMAFEFPRVNPKQLFFPTVHIHDGKVHRKAAFDHELYAQVPAGIPKWTESKLTAGQFMKVDKAKGIVDGASHVFLLEMRGEHPNGDQIV